MSATTSGFSEKWVENSSTFKRTWFDSFASSFNKVELVTEMLDSGADVQKKFLNVVREDKEKGANCFDAQALSDTH